MRRAIAPLAATAAAAAAVFGLVGPPAAQAGSPGSGPAAASASPGSPVARAAAPTLGASRASAAPTLVVRPGRGSVVARWTWPAGAVPTAVRLTVRERSGLAATSSVVIAAGTTTHAFGGLVNGRLYEVRLRVLSPRGAGDWSAPERASAGAPGSLPDVTAWPGQRRVVVRWQGTAPAHGATVTALDVRVHRLSTGTRAWTPVPAASRVVPVRASKRLVLRGLPVGVRHRVTVRAVNARGRGPAATSTAVPVAGLGVVGAVLPLSGPGGLPLSTRREPVEFALSPDRSRIAVTVRDVVENDGFELGGEQLCRAGSDTEVPSQVYVVDLRTGVAALVSATPSGAPGDGCSDGAAWTSDGARVVFRSTATDLAPDRPGQDLFVRDLVSGAVTRIDDGPTGSSDDEVERPVLVAGDSLLVWRTVQTRRATEIRPALVDLATGAVRGLPDDMLNPHVSPDGSTLAYAATAVGGASRIALYDVRTGASTDLGPGTPAGGGAIDPWAPTGSRLVVRRGEVLEVRDLATASARRIADVAVEVVDGEEWADVGGWSWAPDGTRLAYARDERSRLLDLATGAWTRPCPPAGCTVTRWSPDGRRLLVVAEVERLAPGASPRYGGPLVRDLGAPGRYLLPQATASGRLSRGYAGESMWVDPTHVLLATTAALGPGHRDGWNLYLKEVP